MFNSASRSRILFAGFTLGLLLGVVAGGASSAAAAEARPNVVLILIDDLGWADVGCNGSRFYHTPNIDRLAADGMRFTYAYSACPVCSPTRAAIMTGKYPARLHLTDYIPGRPNQPQCKLLRAEFRQELPLEEITLAETLHAAGYATASIGKWHLGGKGFEPQRQGFDLNVGGNESGAVKSHFAPYPREGKPLAGLEDAPEGEHLTERLSAEAEKFIEQNRQRPFFLYLPHYAVHTPLNGKPDLVARYEAGAPTQPGVQKNPVYAAMVESMDESVGRIMKKLEALGLAKNTLFIFTADNGGLATGEGPKTPATINAPLREGKGYLYEGGIRVPLVVRWPGHVAPGSTTSVPVSSYDLPPTIAAACGTKFAEPIDGVSLLGLLTRAEPLERDALYWHYPHYSPQGGRPGGAIRQGDYKLIEYYDPPRRELYNVAKDISESTNLVDKEPERVEQMAAKLASWRTSVDAQMMQPNPAFAPDTQAADGSLTLPAKTADIHGVMLRFEPLPHKNTIGFWVRPEDWVSWDFQINKPGEFELEILQGCGNGSGGSQVDFSVADQTVSTKVEETGDFQAFVPRKIGSVKLPAAGRYTLSVKARSKPGPAVMDLRQVRLVPK